MNNDNALAKTDSTKLANTFADEINIDFASMPETEKIALMREIMEAETALEMASLPSYASRDLLNIPLNILDAMFHTLEIDNEQKVCVMFVFQNRETGEKFTCLKPSNAFNDMYVTRFNKLRGIFYKPLENFQFVEDARYKKAGNVAIVLQKVQEKQISKGK